MKMSSDEHNPSGAAPVRVRTGDLSESAPKVVSAAVSGSHETQLPEEQLTETQIPRVPPVVPQLRAASDDAQAIADFIRRLMMRGVHGDYEAALRG